MTPNSPSTVNVTPPNDPIGDAKALYRNGDFEGSIAKYRAALVEKPKSPDAYAGLIRCYLKQKKVEQAAETAEQALAVSDSPRVRAAYGEVLFRQGKIGEAEKEWVDVTNSGYPEARAYLGLAQVRRTIAMYKRAETMINKAHELSPDDPDIQSLWMATLPPLERIKYLEESLPGQNNWDVDGRESTASYLEYLRERAKRKDRPCRLVSKVKATETPLVRLLRDPSHLRGYGLAVELNGRKSALMLDSGAGGIVVRRAIAERAGVSKVSATKIWGVGSKGKRNAYVGIADSIKIGELEFQSCPVEVMEGSSVADEDGLIGADVFEQFLVDIDFPDEKLKLSELPKRPGEEGKKLSLNSEEDDVDYEDSSESAKDSAATGEKAAAEAHPRGPQDRYIAPEMQSYTRVFRFGHDLLIPTSIGKVPYKLFLLDTGALTNVISPAAAREVTKVSGDPDMIVKGVSGSVDKVYSANKAVLEFGGMRQENQEMVAFDTTSLSDDAGTEISGFLGFSTLRFLDIKIDYRDALVSFGYDSKRWHF